MDTSRISVRRPSWSSRITSQGSSASREGGRRNTALSRPTHASISARRQRRSASSGGIAIGKAFRGDAGGVDGDAPRLDLCRVIILVGAGDLPFQRLRQFGFLRAGQFHHVALCRGGGDHAVGRDRGDWRSGRASGT